MVIQSLISILTLRRGGRGAENNVGLTLSVNFSNFDSPLTPPISTVGILFGHPKKRAPEKLRRNPTIREANFSSLWAKTRSILEYFRQAYTLLFWHRSNGNDGMDYKCAVPHPHF